MQIPRLRQWREFRALTQEELAESAGISVRSVAGYEAGAGARPGTVRRLAEALDIQVADLQDVHPKAFAPLTLDWAISSPDEDEFDRRIAATPTEELRGIVKGLVGNRPALTPDELRQRERRLSNPGERALAFSRAQRIREELRRRGEEDPADYLPDFRKWLDALGFE